MCIHTCTLRHLPIHPLLSKEWEILQQRPDEHPVLHILPHQWASTRGWLPSYSIPAAAHILEWPATFCNVRKRDEEREKARLESVCMLVNLYQNMHTQTLVARIHRWWSDHRNRDRPVLSTLLCVHMHIYDMHLYGYTHLASVCACIYMYIYNVFTHA